MTSPQEFLDLFKVVEEPFEARPELFPTDPVPIVTPHPDNLKDRQVQRARWGFHPSWNLVTTRPLINVRAETALKRPSFKRAFESRRCLLPATIIPRAT
jgi:putative SOS response-associated peptidase YedK